MTKRVKLLWGDENKNSVILEQVVKTKSSDPAWSFELPDGASFEVSSKGTDFMTISKKEK